MLDVGDRVRCVDADYDPLFYLLMYGAVVPSGLLKKGAFYVVTDAHILGDQPFVQVDNQKAENGLRMFWLPERFRKVDTTNVPKAYEAFISNLQGLTTPTPAKELTTV